MKRSFLGAAALGYAVMFGPSIASAGTDTWFNPLTQSAAVGSPNHQNEIHSPWQAPAGITQENLTSMAEAEGQIDVIRVPGLRNGASMWDMVAYDDTGRYIYIPHETFSGAGASRYDTVTDVTEVLFAGDLGGFSGEWENDWGAFDPATYTTHGTVFLAEEWSGEGRVMEILNPKAHASAIRIREVDTIANTSHEGLQFSRDGRSLYYVDEWNSGAIYKLVLKDKRDYMKGGQTFVLKVDAYDGLAVVDESGNNRASYNWNDAVNADQPRTGHATWVPLTDRHGNPLTEIDPFRNGPTNDPRSNDDTRGGRPAADEVGATPFGRPEDMEVGRLRNGREVMYFAATSERTIYSIEMRGRHKAMVRVLASDADTPKNLGFQPTTAVMNSPDNLAQDALGNIYIIEDAPNSSNIGGDIWFVRDVNTDGVAESIDHFLSLQVNGAESTGMIFNPVKPTEFVVAVQHPSSTNLANVPDGFGDALWRFDVSNVVPPTCDDDDNDGRRVRTCSSDRDFNFVRALNRVNGGNDDDDRDDEDDYDDDDDEDDD